MPINFVTHHKCASTWLLNYLREFGVLNAMGVLHTHYSHQEIDSAIPVRAYINAFYPFAAAKLGEGIHVIRNPLDMIVSAYYSHRNTHPFHGWPELAAQRDALRVVDLRDGLFLTLTYLERADFQNGVVGPLFAMRRWNYDDGRFQTLRMEEMVTRPQQALGPLLLQKFEGAALPPDESFTFEAVTGRRVGEIDDQSHYRSGRFDQWRDCLPEGIVTYVRSHFRAFLERFYPETLLSKPASRQRARQALASAFHLGVGGTLNSPSPSSTTASPTLHSHKSRTRRPFSVNSATSTDTSITSPIFTGPRKLRVCEI